ncbi:MAG: ribosome biogenesis factor YjgA [Cardiobacteriaceae bacterium]|nr:ribosome biogenesis factor YjgA [Cardiobacteriaceae bacterium]
MTENEKQYDEEGRVIRENRSEAKREREQIKTFAAELLQLPARQYALLPVSDTLAAALVEGKRLSGNALKRHMNYLTRLLDEHNLEEVRHAHEHINHPYLNDGAKHQRIQRETERLIAADPDILGELIARYDGLDIQHLRALVREAQKQQAALPEAEGGNAANRGGKHQRKILQYLKNLPLNIE